MRIGKKIILGLMITNSLIVLNGCAKETEVLVSEDIEYKEVEEAVDIYIKQMSENEIEGHFFYETEINHIDRYYDDYTVYLNLWSAECKVEEDKLKILRNSEGIGVMRVIKEGNQYGVKRITFPDKKLMENKEFDYSQFLSEEEMTKYLSIDFVGEGLSKKVDKKIEDFCKEKNIEI